MKDKIIGRLGYNKYENRFGILVMDLWQVEGLHCGECLEVWVNDEWINDRIEMSTKDGWYLVNTKFKGDDLEYLKVRY